MACSGDMKPSVPTASPGWVRVALRVSIRDAVPGAAIRARQAEVGEEGAAVAGDQDVGWLDVAVEHANGQWAISERAGDLLDQQQRLPERQRAAPDQAVRAGSRPRRTAITSHGKPSCSNTASTGTMLG